MSQTATKSKVTIVTAFPFLGYFPQSRSEFKTVDVNKGVMQTESEDIVQFAADNNLMVHGDYLKSGETIVGELHIDD